MDDDTVFANALVAELQRQRNEGLGALAQARAQIVVLTAENMRLKMEETDASDEE